MMDLNHLLQKDTLELVELTLSHMDTELNQAQLQAVLIRVFRVQQDEASIYAANLLGEDVSTLGQLISLSENSLRECGFSIGHANYISKASDSNITGSELIRWPLKEVSINYCEETETRVVNSCEPAHIENWTEYHAAMDAFYQTPQAKEILNRRYSKPPVVESYSEIKTHATMTGCLANYLLIPFFKLRMLSNLEFEEESSKRPSQCDILAYRNDESSKVVCTIEVKLGFRVSQDVLRPEKVGDDKPEKNVLLKACNDDVDTQGVRANVIQLYNYMYNCQVKYGILSNYEHTWAFKREGHTLFISQRIPKEDLLKNLLFVLYTANATLDNDQKQIEFFHQEIVDSGQSGDYLAAVNYLLMEEFRLGRAQSIGEGRCGHVYKIKLNDCHVALKMVDAFKCKELVQELIHEDIVYSILKLAGVKCTPTVIHSGFSCGMYILVLEYIEGKHVEFHNMDENMKQMCQQGLSEIHRAKVCHGDLRPQNIIVSKKQIKFIDFGLSTTDQDENALLEEVAQLKRLFESPSSKKLKLKR